MPDQTVVTQREAPSPPVKTRVLVYDRSDSARAGLVALLQRRPGLDVSAAPADLGLAAGLVSAEQPDVVLVDVHHRDTDAEDICRRLGQASGAPLVLLVSFMTDERWLAMRGAGAAAYLLKRVDSEALERDLNAIARRRSGP